MNSIWDKITRLNGLLSLAALLVMIGMYVSIQRQNISDIETLKAQMSVLVPMSSADRAVSDARYVEIQRQLADIQNRLEREIELSELR
jgi:hypothetical protein